MATVKDIYRLLDSKAPFSSQLGFDNSGFLVGRGEAPVSRVLVALDITNEVLSEAIELGAQLIVSHHPVIFRPARSVTDGDPTGRLLLSMAEHGIAAICAHTNLDQARGGVNDALADTLGLEERTLLKVYGHYADETPYGVEQVGILPVGPVPLAEFTALVKERLGSNGVRYVDGGKPVHRVAIGGGTCADSVGEAAAAGCDTFVTADAKYHQFLDAKALGINLIDAGHYPTENVVCPVLATWLREGFPGLEVVESVRHHEVFSYL